MIEVDEATDLAINLTEEPACEARHHNRNPICTGQVTHRYRTHCGEDYLICAASVGYCERYLKSGHCGAQCQASWIPV